MKYRLDEKHYINDRLLEPGHIIGEGTDVPFVDKKGHHLPPSRSMTPLDADAAAVFKKTFPGAELPERDALAAIPIQGSGDPVKTGAVPEAIVPPKVADDHGQPPGAPLKSQQSSDGKK